MQTRRKNGYRRKAFIENALKLVEETGGDLLLLFLSTPSSCSWFLKSGLPSDKVVLVIPESVKVDEKALGSAQIRFIRNWSGNQTRFSRIKYAFLGGIMNGLVQPDDRIVCVLGPAGREHLDTLTIHDLHRSWSEEFPFDPRSLLSKNLLRIVMAVIDIAMDIGAVGREGKSVGTTFVIGDIENTMKLSHQATFNPFKGYSKRERLITRPEVVESLKELAKLDGAVLISETGAVHAAGRHLDAAARMSAQLHGLGSRHRAAAGITKKTGAVAVVVSESTGRVSIFDQGRIIATLEPVISRRVV